MSGGVEGEKGNGVRSNDAGAGDHTRCATQRAVVSLESTAVRRHAAPLGRVVLRRRERRKAME
jgi:hypothetical protein